MGVELGVKVGASGVRCEGGSGVGCEGGSGVGCEGGDGVEMVWEWSWV